MSVINDLPSETINYLDDPIHNLPEDMFREALFSLWKKNIFTRQSYVDENKGTASIILYELDETNERKFNDGVRETGNRFAYKKGKRVITIDLKGKTLITIQNELMMIAKRFVIQNVMYGFMSIEEFLRDYCDCFKIVKSSHKNSNPELTFGGEIVDNNHSSEELIKEFDETKVVDDITTYIKKMSVENLYSPSENRIYFNQMYFNCHIEYELNKNKGKSY